MQTKVKIIPAILM